MTHRGGLTFAAIALLVALIAGSDDVRGQGRGAPPATPRQGALLDLTGQLFVLINAAAGLIVLKRGLGTLVTLNTAAAILVSVVVDVASADLTSSPCRTSQAANRKTSALIAACGQVIEQLVRGMRWFTVALLGS